MTVIRIVASEEERHAIYRFRYSTYVEELGRWQRYADHDRKVIVDPLDSTGYLVGAFRGGEVVGTLRINFSRDSDIGFYATMFDLDRLDDSARTVSSITTRFVVARRMRGTNLAVRLATATYDFGLRNGIEADFIASRPHLLKFYDRLGYRPYKADAEHPEAGRVTPLRLSGRDIEHLRRVRSPFRQVLESLPEQIAVPPQCETPFANYRNAS